jgi:Na+/H+ antiporter NhaD/arsenite permease-like protein
VHSGISYLRFAERLLPVAMLGLVLNYLVVAVVYRSRLGSPRQPADAGNLPRADKNAVEGAPRSRAHARLQIKVVVVTLTAVLLFFTGLPLELVALGAATLVLLDRVAPRKIYNQVDWSLLVMFTGLFIVVHAFQVHVVKRWDIENWTWLLDRPTDMLSLVSAVLSNLVSNVPAVLLLEPVVQAMPNATRETGWLALAMSSTFAGNFTVLGSVANLIVVESAAREGVAISFREYCKVGIPLTILTLAMGIAWLQFVHY